MVNSTIIFTLPSRFTEENFACLIAFIFIKKAIQKVISIGDYYPLHESPCYCIPSNENLTDIYQNLTEFTRKSLMYSHESSITNTY